MKRDSRFDIAKGFLILLVVWGHFTQIHFSVNTPGFLVRWIHLFHMPAFAFLAGYFSSDKSNQTKKFFSFLVPLVVIQIAGLTIDYYFLNFKTLASMNILQPRLGLWFLGSLIIWRIFLLPIFKEIQTIYAIIIASALGIISGTSEDFGSFMMLNRTFGFFPFFLIGAFSKNKKIIWQKFEMRQIAYTSIIFFISSIAICYAIKDLPWKYLGFMNTPETFRTIHTDLSELIFIAIPGRILSYLLRFAFIAAILSIIFYSWKKESAWLKKQAPGILTLLKKANRAIPLKKFGQFSMYIYLLHMLIIQPLQHLNFSVPNHLIFLHLIVGEELFQIIISFTICVALCYMLTSKQIRFIFKNILQPDMSWLLKQKSRQAQIVQFQPKQTDPSDQFKTGQG